MARTILCFGDSNTWGYSPETGERLAPDLRWPGVLAARLGSDARVIEEGLNGRTSAYDDPLDPILNGKTFLPVCLATHAPIDVVVIFLATNDVFLPAGITAHFAAAGVGVLVDMVARSESGPQGIAPQVVAVVPPPFAPLLGDSEAWGPNAFEQSQLFSEAFERMATERDVTVLDLRGVATSSPLDGIHFETEGHRAIGEAVAGVLKGLGGPAGG
jgi:lysophospholipase L1-like esterase